MDQMRFNQAAALLAEVYEQASGKKTIAPIDTTSFVSTATTLLQTGKENTLNAISQVLTRTYINSRKYSSKWNFLFKDNEAYGNHVRIIDILDQDYEDDPHYDLVDGQSIDQYTINKPKALQFNLYGGSNFMISVTYFADQLNSAMEGPEQFMELMAAIGTQIANQLEQIKDDGARALLANFIAGKVSKDSDNVIHLVTLYNDETGLQLTPATVKHPENFKPFAEWLYGKIETFSGLLTERTFKYHMNIEGGDKEYWIPRHTPVEYQRLIMLADTMNSITSRVLSNVYNSEKLKMLPHSSVNFWQSIDAPSGISVSDAAVMDKATGTEVKTGAVAQSNILGVLYDTEALGITLIHESTDTTPYNAKGRYWNQFIRGTKRHWANFTQNALILVLD